MPRNSFKSSCVTVGYAVKRITDDPNIRILISSETQRNAKKFVSEIRNHFEGNQKLKAIYGDFRGNRVWRDDEFVVGRRTKALKEPTVMAASLEKMTVVGMHFDLIILDDPVSQHNINNPDQIKKTIEHYKLLMSILEPGLNKQIITIGTRWSIHDLYGWMLDPDGSEADQFDLIQKQAMDDEGNLLLPEVLTKEFLEEAKKTQGIHHFSCQYLNKPLSSDTATFKEKEIRYYTEAPQNVVHFITVDPAISKEGSADYSGIIVNAVDQNHNWYIKEAIRVKKTPQELLELLMELARRYEPIMCLGMEKFALEKFLQVALGEAMQRTNFYFPIKEIPTDTRVAKEARIRSLQPRFSMGTLFIKKSHVDLYNEIVFHPQVKHDDLLDALKSQLTITFPAPYVAEERVYGDHLSAREKKIWQDVDVIARRKVRETRSGGYEF